MPTDDGDGIFSGAHGSVPGTAGGGHSRAGQSSYASYLATLDTLDRKVIPKLVKRFGSSSQDESRAGTEAEIEWMASTLINGNMADALERARQLLERGWTIDQLYIDLLGGASRRLGELWVADKIDFAKVTITAGRLREVMEELTPNFHAEQTTQITYRGRLMLSPVSGEQHTLGAQMAAAFFKRAGWDVIFTIGDKPERFEEAVGDSEIELIGFSIGSRAKLAALTSDIQFIRVFFKNRNRQPPILVGGSLITGEPAIASECGADGFALDASHALIVAQGYLPSFSPA